MASENEEAALRLMWHLFNDEEIVAFIEELQQDMPVKLRKQQTNSAALTAAVLRKAKEKEAIKQKNTWLRIVSWAAACIIFIIAIAVFYTPPKQDNSNNVLCGNADKGDIPTGEFYCLFDMNGKQRFVIDSNYKGMLQRYGALAVLLRPGVIQYKKMPYSPAADSGKAMVQQISTDNMQQYIVELPDKSRIRLNAMTTIKIYPNRLNDKEQYVELEKGEIYIEENHHSAIPLVLKTPTITFLAKNSSFNVRLDAKGSLLAVETGEVTVRNSHGEEIVRKCFDLSHYIKGKSPEAKDTVNTYNSADIALVTNWKKTERIYKDVQLDYFVADMARWYGFRFTSLDCLPKNKVSTVICYRATIKDFIAVIRNSGAKVWETKEGYAFCDPETKSISGQMAVMEKAMKIRGRN